MNAPFTPQLPSQAYLVLWTGKSFEGQAGEYCQSYAEAHSFIENHCDAGCWSVWSIGNGELSRDVSDEFTFEEVEDREEADYAAASRFARLQRSMTTYGSQP